MGANGKSYRFDDAYEETIRLSDGQRVHLRLMHADDKAMLVEAQRTARLGSWELDLASSRLTWWLTAD